MKNSKQLCRRAFGMLLALAVLFSGVCGGTWTAVVFRASASGNITFTVPETIYLTPSVGSSMQMQYYLNVNPDGSVPQGYSTQGSVYFSNPQATQVQITCSDPSVTLTQTGGTSTVSATVGGHLQSSVPSGTTRLLAWTAAYTENGQQKQVHTYSVLYAPTEDPVGAIAAADAYKNGTSVYAACSTFVYGVQTIRYSASSYLQLDGNVCGSTTLSGTGKYKYPLSGHASTPPAYAGGNQSPAAANLLRSVDSQPQMTSQSGTAFGYVPCGDTRDILVAGGMGRIVYDTSRVTKVGQIPNFYIHSFLNGVGSTGDFSDTVRDLEDQAYYYIADVSAADLTSACGTRYVNGSHTTQSTVTLSSPDFGSIGLCGGYRTLYSAVLRSWKVKPPIHTASDRVQATAAAGCEFYGVDKSNVRSLYLQELSQARQYGGNSAAWQNYQNEMRAAAEYLGTPMNDSTFDLNTLTSAAQTLQNSTLYTLTLDPNGGAFSGSNTAAQTIAQTAGSTYTLPTNLARNGYSFSGWQRQDGSMVGSSYTFGTQNETLTAKWTARMVNLTFAPNGGAFTAANGFASGTASQNKPVAYGSTYGASSNGKTWPVITRSGFTFVGWNICQDGSGTMVAATDTVTTTNSLTLYAVWTANSCTLTLDPNGGAFADGSTASRTITQLHGSTYTLPTNLLRNGYSFSGWQRQDGSTVGSSYTFGTQNETLTAKWTANTYTVMYNGNGATSGSTESSTHTFGVPQALTANGFARAFTVAFDHNYEGAADTTDTAAASFQGWNTAADGSGTAYADGAVVTGLTTDPGRSVILYAQWMDGSVTLPALSRSGYTFGGWYADTAYTVFAGAGGAEYTPSANCTLRAKWSLTTRPLVFYPNGGTFAAANGFMAATSPLTKQILFGDLFGTADNAGRTWPQITLDGYILAGWNTEQDGSGAMVSATDTVETVEPMRLYAIWTSASSDLTLEANGGAFADGSTAPQMIMQPAGSTYTLPTDLVRNGYTFAGWTDGSGNTVSNPYTFGAQNETLTAQWTPVVNTLTLDPDGGVWPDGTTGVDTETGCIGDALVVAPPTKAGYAFVGWQLSNGATGSVDNTTGTYVYGWSDDTLTAQWTNVGTLSLSFPGGIGGRPLTPGTLFPVTLHISDNPGLISLFVQMHYDPAMLELDHVDDLQLFGACSDPNDPVFNRGGDYAANPFAVSWTNAGASQNYTQNGDLLIYWFRVRHTAHVDRTTVSVSYWQASTFDANLDDVLFNTGSLSIPVSAMIGDVNYNCAVSMADAVRLMRHLHHPSVYTIAACNSDVNGDTVIDRNDAITIIQSLNGSSSTQLPYYVNP